MYLLNLAIFGLLFGLPLIPGLLEILKPRDDTSLSLNSNYARNPHFFGDSMRAKVAPLLSQRGRESPYEVPFLGRRGERAHLAERIIVPPRNATEDVLIAFDHLEIKPDASLLDGYGIGSVTASDRTFARTLLSDGDVRLGSGCKVGRWIDAAGALRVGESCDLGRSATAGKRFTIGAGTRFTRAFGMPIIAQGDAPITEAEGGAAKKSTISSDLVGHHDVRVDAGCVVSGSVKADGSLTIGAGAHIKGNAIARGSVMIERGARIDGHVFTEEWLTIGPRVRIGMPGSSRTAYGAFGVKLSPTAQIFGWLVSDRNGRVA